jgi:sortase A
MRRLLAWCFVLGGLVLAGAGARILYLSYRSQSEAAKEWKSRTPQAPALRPGDLIGRLSIPRLNAEWFLLEGATDDVLERGPGHLEGTAAPGAAGNCVVAGHRDTHFRPLKDIRDGDEILVEANGRTFTYRVTEKRVVYPTNTKLIQPEPDARLTLVTCFPFYYVGPAPKRFIVQAELVNPDVPGDGRVSGGPESTRAPSKPG